MAISNFQIHEWRKEYLQELKDTLTRAASYGYYEQLMKEFTPEDLAEVSDDDVLLIEFLFKKLIPFFEFMAFQDRNNSLKDRRPEAVEGESYPRYTMSDVFDYISGMTNYGKYHVVNQFPGDDEIFEELRDAIFMNDKDAFLSTIKEKSVDFSSFRERISASMFLASCCNEMKDRYLIGVLGNPDCLEDTEKMEIEHKEISEYGNYMIEHLSRPAYEVITDVCEVFEGLLKMGEEDDIDEEKIQLVSCLHFSDSELWGLFLGTAYYFGFFSYIIEDSFTNPELAILNEFLDDPHTNRILNDMERALYLMTEGEIFPKKIFIPQSVRDEIESGRINDTIRQLYFGLKEVDEQEQPKEKVVALPEGERKPTEQEEYVPHWPTDDELFGYDNNFDYHQFFKQSIFGLPLQVKASDVEKLISVLTSMGVIDEDLDTKLIFLSRYSGKKIPHLELHPIEWKYLSEDWEKALGYLIHMTSVGRTDFAKGRSFFYYNKNGVKMMPDREALAGGGHAWALSGRLEKTRTPFEKALNKFLADYKESKMD